jgi:hypothetical protein
MIPAAWVVLAALSSGGGEGVLTQKLTLPQGSGEQRTFLSERGLRSEVDFQMRDQTLRTAFVAEAGTGRGYSLDDQTRTYKEVAFNAGADAGGGGFPVTLQPPEVLLGRQCKHVQLQLAPDTTADYWTTREMLGPRALELIPMAAQLPAGIRAALHSADADGLVMKMVQRKGGQVLLSLEPVSFKAAAVPPGALKLPPGYRPAPPK